ncbi:MAG TPA: hypothetical protein VJL29_01615, partial [Thermoguttaceae bacterium]|nr:hypothetical protein [Thermoguttaceae bacterium]
RRYRDEKFTVFSLQQGVLDEVVPQLRLEEAERAAQIRLHFSDPTRAQLAPTVARMSVMRTRGTTLGNLRLMHAMTEQLHVPGPDAKAVAELILDARLVCPLGGEYEYRPRTDGSGYWTSTALEPGPDGRTADVPAGWTAPPLSWFRGLEADLAMTRTELSAHVEVWMRLPEKPLVAEPADVAPAAPEVVPTPEGANAKAQGREDAKEE